MADSVGAEGGDTFVQQLVLASEGVKIPPVSVFKLASISTSVQVSIT